MCGRCMRDIKMVMKAEINKGWIGVKNKFSDGIYKMICYKILDCPIKSGNDSPPFSVIPA
jgi:hypothetical protein